MAKEKTPEYYRDFIRIQQERGKEQFAKRQRRLLISVFIILVYIITSAFVGFFITQGNFFSNFSLIRPDQSEYFKNLDQRLAILEKKIDEFSNTNVENFPIRNLNSKILAIEQKNSYLYDTILSNPDSAITPKILKEEQENLAEKVQDLRSRVDATNGTIIAFFITLVVLLLAWVGKQVWDTYFKRKDEIRD